jgi:hypothetical protein
MAYDMTSDEGLEALARITPQWLAGFVDGEGCVSVCRNPKLHTVQLIVAQSEPKVLFAICVKFPSGIVKERVQKGHRGFTIRWCGRNVIPVLEYIKDHVICKRRQVDYALEMAKLINSTSIPSVSNSKRREELASMIRQANHGIDTFVDTSEVLP